MKSKRKAIQEQRRRKKTYTIIGISVLVIAVLGIMGFILMRSSPAPVGQAVAVMPDRNHVADGTNPGPYNTDPPSSGTHYAEPVAAGFYNEGDVPGPYPEGHLVHSLEHGYVIFWYNCASLSTPQCDALKDQIKSVMSAEANNKVIAYPWKSIDVPVVMTSWGHMLRMQAFDSALAKRYVDQYRNQSPEPDGP